MVFNFKKTRIFWILSSLKLSKNISLVDSRLQSMFTYLDNYYAVRQCTKAPNIAIYPMTGDVAKHIDTKFYLPL